MPLNSFTIEILNNKPVLHSDRNEKCQLSVELIVNSNISYIELKTDSLHIKALREDCDKYFQG